MANDYQINTTDNEQVFAHAVVFVDFTNTKPIAGGILGEDWVFFYKVNPPVTWDDISASVKRECIKTFTQLK